MGGAWWFQCGIKVDHTIPYHTIPYHTIPYHTIPYHTIPYHTLPTLPTIPLPTYLPYLPTIPYHTYHTIPYHTIPYHTIPYHTIPYHTIPYHTIPYHTIPYHTIPWVCYRRRNQWLRLALALFCLPLIWLARVVYLLVGVAEGWGGRRGHAYPCVGLGHAMLALRRHTIPYHTIPYHTIPYHTIPYHTIPYHTIPHHTIPHRAHIGTAACCLLLLLRQMIAGMAAPFSRTTRATHAGRPRSSRCGSTAPTEPPLRLGCMALLAQHVSLFSPTFPVV